MSGFVDDLVSTLRVACVLDPAIDREQTDVLAYAEKRDPSMIVTLPGLSPRWFHLRPLTQSQVASCDAHVADAQRWNVAFCLSVEAIDCLLVPGEAWRPTTRVRDPASGKTIRVINDRELEVVHRALGKAWIYEVGRVAYDRADEGNALGGSASYTLPPTSVSGLARIALRLAEHTPTDSTTESSELSAGSSGPTPAEP